MTLVYLSGAKVFTALKAKRVAKKVSNDAGVIMDLDEEEEEAEYSASQPDSDEDEMAMRTPMAAQTLQGKGKVKSKVTDPFRSMGSVGPDEKGTSSN